MGQGHICIILNSNFPSLTFISVTARSPQSVTFGHSKLLGVAEPSLLYKVLKIEEVIGAEIAIKAILRDKFPQPNPRRLAFRADPADVINILTISSEPEMPTAEKVDFSSAARLAFSARLPEACLEYERILKQHWSGQSAKLDGISAMDFGSYIACCYKANRTPMFRQLLSDRNYGNAITEAAITFCGNYLVRPEQPPSR